MAEGDDQDVEVVLDAIILTPPDRILVGSDSEGEAVSYTHLTLPTILLV